jgi:hypothetical protein
MVAFGSAAMSQALTISPIWGFRSAGHETGEAFISLAVRETRPLAPKVFTASTVTAAFNQRR